MKEELEPRASEENTFTQDVQGTSRGPLTQRQLLAGADMEAKTKKNSTYKGRVVSKSLFSTAPLLLVLKTPFPSVAHYSFL